MHMHLKSTPSTTHVEVNVDVNKKYTRARYPVVDRMIMNTLNTGSSEVITLVITGEYGGDYVPPNPL